MKRRTTMLLAPVALLLAVGLVAGVVLRGWLGADKSSAEFPQFVYYTESTEAAYRLAVDNQPLFANVNCYCGCVNLPKDPHRNLQDCFFNDDGSFDAHASGCSVCEDIAVDAVAWQARGKSLDEIASLIDDEYESVGPPTRQ